jgi:hypothetical protein
MTVFGERRRCGTGAGMTVLVRWQKTKKEKAYTEVAESTEFTEKRNPGPRHTLRAWGNQKKQRGISFSADSARNDGSS